MATTTDTATDPEIRKTFVMLSGERNPEGGYTLHGLTEGKDFRREGNYEALEASMLKVEDVGFAAPAFELSEYRTYIVVEQKSEGGMANITFEAFEETGR